MTGPETGDGGNEPYVIRYKMCGHLFSITQRDSAERLRQVFTTLVVRAATDVDIAEMLLPRQPCVCRINDAKLLKVWAQQTGENP